MKIAITGAAGQLGHLVIQRLRDKVPASDIIALVRTPPKAADLGVEVRQADYSQPDTLDKALVGVDKLLMISGSEIGQRVAQHRNIIDAAKKAGVKHVAYTSLLHANRSTLSLAPEHVETEAMLKASGLGYTVLRNGWYTDNYIPRIGGAVANGALIGSAGQGKIASASRADYADAAVAVLTSPGHEGKTYELAGDKAFTMTELAAEISRQTGKTISYQDLPPAEYAAVLTKSGMPAPWPQAMSEMEREVSKGVLFDDSLVLSKLIGHPTTPLKETVANGLKAA